MHGLELSVKVGVWRGRGRVPDKESTAVGWVQTKPEEKEEGQEKRN